MAKLSHLDWKMVIHRTGAYPGFLEWGFHQQETTIYLELTLISC